MSKILISDLNERDLFSNFTLYSKGCHFSITRFGILILYNIQHLEINFAVLQMNFIPLPVTMNRKIKKPLVKLHFWQLQQSNK